jgi:uncharacterized membrane protein YbhN (UPF0104 family)
VSASTARSRAANLAKALAAVAILALVLYKVPLADLKPRVLALRAADIALLVALTIAQVTGGVVRWGRLLTRLGERVSFAALFGDVLVGLAYNMFLPTTVGGDVVRAWRASRRVEASHRAWSTSIFERIAGLLAMAATGAIAAVFAVGSVVAVPATVRWLAIAIAAALMIVFFAASAPFRVLEKLLEKRLPEPAARDLRGIVADLAGPLAGAGPRVEALAWSLAYQALGIAFVVAGARALGAPGHETAIVVGVPLVHVLSMIPVTLGGHGLRDGLFVGVLGQLGVAPDVALGLAAQWLASSVLFAIAGAIVNVVARSATPATPPSSRSPSP